MKRTDQYDPAALKHMEKEFDQWEQNEVSSFIKRAPESKTEYTTASGMPTKRTYTPLDLKNTPFEDIGFPGQYPPAHAVDRGRGLDVPVVVAPVPETGTASTRPGAPGGRYPDQDRANSGGADNHVAGLAAESRYSGCKAGWPGAGGLALPGCAKPRLGALAAAGR